MKDRFKPSLSDIELDDQIENGLYAVACTDLHACMAPFTKAQALMVAKRLTSMGDGCTYRAVVLITATGRP